MKKAKRRNPAFYLLSFLLLCSLSLSVIGCRSGGADGESTAVSSDDEYASIIIQLQNRIEELQSEQNASESENGKKLEELKSELESLRAESETSTESTDAQSSSEQIVGAYFTYTSDGSKATITGYTGDDEELVIPSYIDGYKVEAIADSAFASATLKRVTVSNGIKSIGWFAFYACPAMTSITLPESIESIGHSAFSPTGRLTVYCHASSFAHEYAKSYALDYALI